MGWLIASWLAFGITIVSILASFRYSGQAYQYETDVLDEQYTTKLECDRKHISKLNRKVLLTNWIAMFAFVAGFCLQAVYIFANFSQPVAGK